MDVITRVGYTPFFCFPQFPFCRWIPADGKQVGFASYTWRTFPWTIFQLYDANLYCTAFYGSTCFSQYMNSKYFQWSSRSERGQKFSREKWCSIIWTALHRDQISFCKCFDLPGYYAGYGLCKLWTQMQSHCLACKSCQPQPPSRSTIPPDFPPIWLRDTERSELVLPIFSMVRESCKPQQPVGWTFNDELRSTLA